MKSTSASTAPQLRGARTFSFDELRKITNNFSEANDIGNGGYGKVIDPSDQNRLCVLIGQVYRLLKFC